MSKKKKRPVQVKKPSYTIIPYAAGPLILPSTELKSYSRIANLEKLLSEQFDAKASSLTSSTSSPSSSSATSAPSSPPPRPEPAPSAPSSPQIDPYTAQLSIESARARYDDLWFMGATESPAFSRLNDEQFPTDDDIERMGQSDLNKWYLIAESFLADPTSTAEGYEKWKWQHDISFYKGAFGGHWGDKNYDTSRIDESLAKEVFKAYRMLEEEYEALIMEYGSENLIEELYTAAIEGKDYLQYGMDQLEALKKKKADFWRTTEREHPANAISGVRGDWTEEDIRDLNW